MSLFDKFAPLAAIRAELARSGAAPFGVVNEEILSPTEARIDGRKVILAGTNNYLGLTFDPECIEAAVEALRTQGTGTTGSRMANGTYATHVALEQELAHFFGARSAIVFSTGYHATLGMVSTLAQRGDTVFIDADCHASIYDGCKLGGAEIIRFKHNDAADLDRKLARLGDKAADSLIVAEGIYSMLGDRAPLADFVEVKRRHGGVLLLDEAHSLGVLGEHGRGLAEEAGVEDAVDFVVGTFSKSLGAIGGYCVSRRPELELVRYAIRAYIFTASPSPSVIASTRVALRLLAERPELRARLWENANRLYTGLKALGFTLGPEPAPVVAAQVPDREAALAGWRALLDHGVYVNVVFPPASPGNYCLLRASLSAAHSLEQIDRILAAYATIAPDARASARG